MLISWNVTFFAFLKKLSGRQMLCSQSTSNIRYSSLMLDGRRKRGSRQVCAKNMSVTYVIDSSLTESRLSTVTWKYTTVGWPSSLGALFLSYSRCGFGIMSASERLAVMCSLWLLFLLANFFGNYSWVEHLISDHSQLYGKWARTWRPSQRMNWFARISSN